MMAPSPMVWLTALSAFVGGAQQQAEDVARLSRSAGGDGSALAALYDRHARGVYSIALRVLGDEGEAEDVVQEVFAQAWRQSARYDARRGTVAAWFLMMARTRAIDRLRARRARPEGSGKPPESSWGELPAATADPVDVLDIERNALRVRDALRDLPILQRVAIELAYFEGLTQSEIAQRLEEPLGTVKTRIRQGLLKLRDALSGTVSGGAA
jgi:RNA polymerase sigma-70 factor (ECF subfamily)